MAEQMKITVSPPDFNGDCNVWARCGELDYLEWFNPRYSDRRRKFAEEALRRFGWEEDSEQIAAIESAVAVEFRKQTLMPQPVNERVDKVRLDQITSEEVEWLWPGRIAFGKLTVIAGDPGLGKSLLTLKLAADVTRGRRFPGAETVCPLAHVSLLSAEDNFNDTIRPRLEAAGADLTRIHALTGVVPMDASSDEPRPLDVLRDIDILRKAIEEDPPPRLLIIDPISEFLGEMGENTNAEVRRLLAPLRALAQETNTAIVVVSHLRKAKGSGLHRIIGSIAFTAVSRLSLIVQRKNEPGRAARRLVPVKSNVSRDSSAICFYVEEDPVTHRPFIEWGPIEPHDGFSLPKDQRGRPHSITREQKRLIDQRLAKGPTPISELIYVLGDDAPSPKTIARFLNKHYRRCEEKLGPWTQWELPETGVPEGDGQNQ